MSSGQLQLEFFKNGGYAPSPEARRAFLDPTNPSSPYFGFIGNRRAIDKLIRIDFEALGRYNHVCNDLSVAFLGQASSGKTEIARRHARANRLPLVEISPKSVKTVQDIFNEIDKACDKAGIPLNEVHHCDHYVIPPINLFIDEVHALSNSIVQGLLKATEHNDGILATEKGLICDCKLVHWMIATTDRGRLFDAFDTRFSKITLNLYTKDEIAQIVNFANQDWSFDICQLVAHYCGRVPREALAFAREMRLEFNMHPMMNWVDISKRVAEDNEIDPFGMTYKRLAILKALGQGPVSEKRLPTIAGVKTEELDKFILPWLMASTDDQQPLIEVTNKGYAITQAGINELVLRNIRREVYDDMLWKKEAV